MDVAQRAEVLDRKTDAVKQRDLRRAGAALDVTGHHLPELGHRVIIGQLLDLPFDAGLGRVFDENLASVKDRLGQFGLARTIAADRVDMHAGPDVVVRQDGGMFLVGSAGGDDLGAFHGFCGA